MNSSIIRATLFAAAAVLLVTPAYADHREGSKDRGRGVSTQTSARRDCLKSAAKTFVDAVHAANASYKQSRSEVIAKARAGMKAATTKEERKAVRATFKSELKSARDLRKSDFRAALGTFRAAKKECQTIKPGSEENGEEESED